MSEDEISTSELQAELELVKHKLRLYIKKCDRLKLENRALVKIISDSA